jgi:hypothetical protein
LIQKIIKKFLKLDYKKTLKPRAVGILPMAGEYFAVGVKGAVTGRGADLLIIDDPHSEQDVNSPNAFDQAWEWYTSGPRQRLQPGGRIVVVMTRWSVLKI